MIAGMERVLVNVDGRIRREVRNGREYLVAPMTLIVPGVLNGSKGPLYYPPDEILKDPSAWNGIPIVVYHPTHNGQHISARDPDVLERQQIGNVFRSQVVMQGPPEKQGRLVAEGWFDVEATRRVDKRILERLSRGDPIELSTGLFTDNEQARPGANYRGKSYEYVARNYKPDHLAILPDQKGACSVEDGCGVLANEQQQNVLKQIHELITQALGGQPRHGDTGQYQPHGAGTGKGAPHAAAVAGHMTLCDTDKRLGMMAQMEKEATGHNPPSWAVDEGTWDKAKAAAEKSGYSEGDGTYWAVVAHIYQQMGGDVQAGSAEHQRQRDAAHNVENDHPEVTNTGDIPMTLNAKARAGLINLLITNGCACANDRDTLHKLSDKTLLAMNADKEDAKDKEDMPMKKKDMKGMKDEEDDEPAKKPGNEEETENLHSYDGGEKDRPTKNQPTMPSTPTPTVMSADAVKEFVGNMQDDQRLPFARALLASLNLSAKDWLSLAPEPVQEVVTNAAAVERDERMKLVKALVANVQDDETRQRVGDTLMKKSIGELRDLLAIQPAPPRSAAAPLYLGSGPIPQPVANQDERDDILPLPVMNYSEWVAEESGRRKVN